MRSIPVLSLVLALAACDSPPDPTAPGSDPSGASLSSTMTEVSQEPVPEHKAVAQVVPGFGGYFLENGVPTVYLTDASQRPLAEQALAGFLADRGFTASDLQVRQAAYSYLELDAWYEQAWPKALGVEGAVYTDIAEGDNHLRFGALDAAGVANVTAAVLAAGVPSEAFEVVETAAIEQLHTLRDKVRPVDGGYQINFLDLASPGVRTLSFVCTLGFNVVKDGVSSFMTNSHCTNHQGGTEDTKYYQPLMDDGDRVVQEANVIGIEAEDPEYDAISCATDFLPGTVCRFSDASRAQYVDGVPFQLGRLARTTESYQDTPRDADDNRVPVLDVDPENPHFIIQSEQKRSVLGETANKVGRTTGWTFGPVIETCINTLVLGTVPPIVQRCQDRVRGDVAGGDSGSPVFRRRGNSDNVRLMGILWGGSVSGTTTFVFSPMSNIHSELGDFQTH